MNIQERLAKIEALETFLEKEKGRVPNHVYLMTMKEFLDLISDQLTEARADLQVEVERAKKHRAMAALQGASDELMDKANNLIWTVGASLLNIEKQMVELESKKARLAKLMK